MRIGLYLFSLTPYSFVQLIEKILNILKIGTCNLRSDRFIEKGSMISGRIMKELDRAVHPKLSELGTQLEGGSPYLIDWLLSLTSTQQTLHKLPSLRLYSHHSPATPNKLGLCHVSLQGLLPYLQRTDGYSLQLHRGAHRYCLSSPAVSVALQAQLS